ncbi:MAG: hypothetical protein Hals2KO_05460 [Halioglobus sp.]
MAELKPGARLRSAVCAAEVVVIAAPEGDLEVTCGGVAMLGEGESAGADSQLAAEAADGSELGKRYTNAAGDTELLCVKPGEGSLAVGGETLVIKGAKPLPSSD